MVRPGALRKRKLAAKLDPDVYAQRFRDQRDSMLEQAGVAWSEQAFMSGKIKPVLEAAGVPSWMVAPYLCFGREILRIRKKFMAIKAGDENIEAIDVWSERGLDRVLLNLISQRFGDFPVWKADGRDRVLCLNFDRGVGDEALDISGYGNHGTLFGPTWVGGVSNRVFGKALSFDGENDYVNCGRDTSLDLGDAFTIEAWVKHSIYGYYPTIIARIDAGGLYNRFWELSFLSTTGRLEGACQDGAGGKYSMVRSSNIVADGEWHHAVWLRDGDIQRIYVDTEDVTVVVHIDAGIGDINPPTDVVIGGDIESDKYYLKGLEDEVRVYTRALSPAEILRHYRVGARHLGLGV